MPTTNKPLSVDEYLAALPSDVQNALQGLRQTIKSIVPAAEERIAYKIPVFSFHGDLVGFSAQRNPKNKKCSFYTMSPPLVSSMKQELKDFEISGATIHFTPDKPLPKSLVRGLVEARVAENKEKNKKP